MQAEQKSFKTFEDLQVYQVAREFRKSMYVVAQRLPDFEKFGLANQIRRTAVSQSQKAGSAFTLHELSPDYSAAIKDFESDDSSHDSTIQQFNDLTTYRE